MLKKLINHYNKLNERFQFILFTGFIIFFQILIFFFLNHSNSFASLDLTDGDAFSFYYYNYTNIENFLSQYRSFGGPIIVGIFKLFSKNLTYWGQINFIFFSLCLIILFYSLVQFKIQKNFSFFFVMGILGSTKLWWYFTSWSEVLSVSFIILTFASYLLSQNQKNNYFYIIFGFLLFFTYQIRPLFVVYVFAFIIFEIYLIKFKNKKKINFKNSRLILLTAGPLIFFLIVRFLITGHFGIAPYMGAHIGAHSLFFLTKENIPNISKKNEVFANKIYNRKLNHKSPCNLNFNDIEKDQYSSCYAKNTMSLILEMIKHKENKEPFPKNDSRNFNSWEHVKTLDKFFMTIDNHNEIDNDLKNFSIEIIKPEFVNFVKIFISNFKNAYKIQLGNNNKLTILYFLIIIMVVTIKIISFKSYSIEKNQISLKYNDLLLFFLFSNLLAIILLSLIHIPKMRIMTVQGIFLIPIIFSYIICNLSNCLFKEKI